MSCSYGNTSGLIKDLSKISKVEVSSVSVFFIVFFSVGLNTYYYSIVFNIYRLID